jgi:glycerol uptake facilitator-like aquaporin
MDSTFVSEMIGTGLLILLGDGVVAAVLLNKSKARTPGGSSSPSAGRSA